MYGHADKLRVLVLYSSKNARGRRDASGAFIPEALAFARVHGVPDERVIGMPLVGVPRARRKERTLQAIHDAGTAEPLDAIMMFGHGWPNGVQFGILRKDIPELGALLARKCRPSLRICLYACLTAENDVRDTDHKRVGPGTDGGFADLLRDEMVRVGIDRGLVDAHKPAGHATWNPFVVRFLCSAVSDPEVGGEGGAWIVAPRSEHWATWVRRFRISADSLRFRVPFLSELQIKAELAGIPWTALSPI